MSCSYRIVLVTDGGLDALLVLVVGLSALLRRVHSVDIDKSLYNWIDLLVASGDSVLLASLLAKHQISLFEELAALEKLLKYQNNGYSKEMVSLLFNEEDTLYALRKHFLFMTYDVDSDELFHFSDSRPTQQSIKIDSVLKACMGNPNQQQFIKLGYRRLMNASQFAPNPILQAMHYADCLYQEDSVVIVSIGSGKHRDADLEQQFSEQAHLEFEDEIRKYKKWHYFRFNPEFERNDSLEEKIEKTRSYFENQAPAMDRLLHLMEIKSGKLV
jgi:hypothetical protein